MDQYRYRRGARIVAILECIFAMLLVLLLISSFLRGYTIFKENSADHLHTFLDEMSPGFIKGWVYAILTTIISVLIGIAAFTLWKATQIGVSPTQALPRLKFWIVITIITIIYDGIYAFGMNDLFSLIAFLITLIVNCIYFYVVGMYLRELEAVKKSNYVAVHFDKIRVVDVEDGIQNEVGPSDNMKFTIN